MRKSTFQRTGATMLALALVVPLGAGLATAAEQAPEETTATEVPAGEVAGAEAGSEVTDAEAGSVAPTVGAEVPADEAVAQAVEPVPVETAAPEAAPAAQAPAPATQVAPGVCDEWRPVDSLAVSMTSYTPVVDWSPTGPARVTFGGLSADGWFNGMGIGDVSCYGASWLVEVIDWDARGTASEQDRPWQGIDVVNGDYAIDGLAPGDYAVTFRAEYRNADGLVVVGRSETMHILVRSLDQTIETLVRPGETPLVTRPGQQTAYSELDGTFAPEPVDLYLIDRAGGSRLIATGEAPAVGNVNIGFTVPADLTPGGYYLMGVGRQSGRIGGRHLTVEIAPSAPVLTEIGINVSHQDHLSWLPSRTYGADLTGLSVDGRTAQGAVVRDVDVRWTYSLGGGDPVPFTPVAGTFRVPGLTEGANTVVLVAEHVQDDGTGTGTISRVAAETELDITVGSLADLLAGLRSDTTLPSSTTAPGRTSRFTADAGFYAPGEQVTITAVPEQAAPAARTGRVALAARTTPSTLAGPVVLATGTADADGSLTLDVLVPADLALGTYYLLAEGGSGHTLGIHRLTVATDATTPAGTAPAAPVASAPTTRTTSAAVLATTGSEASTGLLVAGLLTAVGAGAAFGAARFRKVRAARA